jgi:hypothetical protein
MSITPTSGHFSNPLSRIPNKKRVLGYSALPLDLWFTMRRTCFGVVSGFKLVAFKFEPIAEINYYLLPRIELLMFLSSTVTLI